LNDRSVFIFTGTQQTRKLEYSLISQPLHLGGADGRRLAGSFLGAFAKLREAIISCVMCVRPSVRIEQLGYRLTEFHEILYLSIFRKSVKKFKFH
jgi:hypothetical protein